MIPSLPIGKVDEQVRAGLKGQTPVVVEFPIGKEGITLDFAEQVEKGLTVLGKHTYLYHPAAIEHYAEVIFVTRSIRNSSPSVLCLSNSSTTIFSENSRSVKKESLLILQSR